MIIALNGYAKSGKDEIAKMIIEMDPTWQVKKFSNKLKQVASILTGIHPDKFEDQLFKNSPLSDDWFVWDYKTIAGGTLTEPTFNVDPKLRSMTARELLQKLGTDAIRNGLHENAWVNALMSEYREEDTRLSEYIRVDKSKWIITDCRFHNEAFAVRDRGGIIIRVNRPGNGPVNNHISETAIDGFDFNYVINNDGDIEDLRTKVKDLLNQIQ
jgi:hypothetical protein